MGIIDKVTALVPWRRTRPEPPAARSDVLAFRDDLDRWLQQVFAKPRGAVSELQWMPSTNVHETDDELVVTVEVPGLDRDDLDLTINPEGLTIRGEKREEREDRRKDYHLVESRYGSFVRSVPLPPGLDLDRAEARVKNGVLTIRFPKAAARPGTRRVPIKT